jgi:hypothetical protein
MQPGGRLTEIRKLTEVEGLLRGGVNRIAERRPGEYALLMPRVE